MHLLLFENLIQIQLKLSQLHAQLLLTIFLDHLGGRLEAFAPFFKFEQFWGFFHYKEYVAYTFKIQDCREMILLTYR